MGALLASVPMPPASGSAGLPTPFAPWQARHFCSYTFTPWRALPLPPGSPAPLGGMLISQRATSSALTLSPRAGRLPTGCGVAHAASAATAQTIIRLGVNILHAPVGADCPADDRVVV